MSPTSEAPALSWGLCAANTGGHGPGAMAGWPGPSPCGGPCSLGVGLGYGRLAKVMGGELIGSSAAQQGSDATICCVGARAIGHVCEAVHGSKCFVNPWAFTVFGDITI